MIKSITTKTIINNKQVMINKIKQQTYKFNKDVLDFHIELNKYSNPSRFNYDSKFDKLLKITAWKQPFIEIGDIDEGVDIFD